MADAKMIIIGLVMVAVAWFVLPGAGDIGYFSGMVAGAGALLLVIGFIWPKRTV